MARLEAIPAAWWGKVAVAGIVGGIGMGLYEMLAMVAMGQGFWAPMNMIGATVPAFRPPAPDFVMGPTLTGMALHMITAAAWGLIFGALVAYFRPELARSYGGQTLLGLGFGVLVYGVVTALMTLALTDRREMTVTFAPEAPVAAGERTFR